MGQQSEQVFKWRGFEINPENNRYEKKCFNYTLSAKDLDWNMIYGDTEWKYIEFFPNPSEPLASELDEFERFARYTWNLIENGLI